MGTSALQIRPSVITSVHPHTRGDIGPECRHELYKRGSPPHAWGHQLILSHGSSADLFTPTRVGTSVGQVGLSSPSLRFTPTRVGTSTFQRINLSIASVHPHTRGDIAAPDFRDDMLHWFTPTRVGDICCCLAASIRLPGSPPHAWGHLRCSGRHADFVRFTPTRVGTSWIRGVTRLPIPVHPHTRGDIPRLPSEIATSTGSPPHAWGHHHIVDYLPHRCAVHPHTRGDIGT